jgi:hypothetical protein
MPKRTAKFEEYDAMDLVDFAVAWDELGPAIQDQVFGVMDNIEYDANPEAIKRALDKLGKFHQDFEDTFTEWLENYGDF